jgi:hypothetical protein
MRNMKLSSNNISATFSMRDNGEDARFFDNIIIYGGDLDYEKLKNKPTLNGKEIVGNMVENDPQVPAWAKEEEVPVEPIPTDVVEGWLNKNDNEDNEEETD